MSSFLQRSIQVLHDPKDLSLEDAARVSAHARRGRHNGRDAERVLDVTAACALLTRWRHLRSTRAKVISTQLHHLHGSYEGSALRFCAIAQSRIPALRFPFHDRCRGVSAAY